VTFIGFLIVFGGLVGSLIALVMIARRRSSEAAFPRVMPHMLLLAAMWVGYLAVFTGTTGQPPAAAPATSSAPVVGTPAPAAGAAAPAAAAR
jgi:hypothetical protein